MNGRTIYIRNVGLGAGLVLLAAGVVVETLNMTVGFSYDKLGPRAFPFIIAAGLLVSGVAIVVPAVSRAGAPEQGDRYNWLPIALISATLLMQMYFIRSVGWIPMATVTFAIVAWAFGNRRIVASLLFGAALAIGTFFLFNYGLGLRLPVGQLVEPLF